MILNKGKLQYLAKKYKNIKPLIKSKEAQSYFTISLSLFCLSFFGIFAIRPTLLTAISLVKQIEDLKTLNSKFEDKLGTIIKAQTEYEKVRKAIPLIDSAIPSYAHFNKLALSLENFASRSGITISHMRIDSTPISKPKPKGKYEQYGFSITGIGDYSSVYFYLKHLLNWERLITIDSIDLERQGSGLTLLQFTLKGKAYYGS